MFVPHVFRSFLALLLAIALGGSGAALADDEGPQERKRSDPQIDLPESEGRDLVLRACTMCHVLGGIAGYKGYWGFEQWKEMVEAMVKHGAVLNPAEQDIVAAYLTRHFGRDAR